MISGDLGCVGDVGESVIFQFSVVPPTFSARPYPVHAAESTVKGSSHGASVSLTRVELVLCTHTGLCIRNQQIDVISWSLVGHVPTTRMRFCSCRGLLSFVTINSCTKTPRAVADLARNILESISRLIHELRLVMGAVDVTL